MRYTWDPAKADENWKKHGGITFEEAAEALETDPNAIRELDRDVIDELRLRVLVWSVVGRVLFVVTVEIEDDETRIISARKADAKEELHYHAQNDQTGNDQLRNRPIRRRSKRPRGPRKHS